MSVADRATLANMAPGMAPPVVSSPWMQDPALHASHRPHEVIARRSLLPAQHLFRDASSLTLNSAILSAGPVRLSTLAGQAAQDRVALSEMKEAFQSIDRTSKEAQLHYPPGCQLKLPSERMAAPYRSGTVLSLSPRSPPAQIPAILRLWSRPVCLLKKREKGLPSNLMLKPTLAPGSRVVTVSQTS
jgi:hypothetical protein